MITRLWRGWTTIDDAEAYERFLRGDLFPSMREIPGFLGADVLRRVDDREVAFVTLARFDSLEAVRAFAGDDYETPVLEPRARALLSRYEQRALHFDTAPAARLSDRFRAAVERGNVDQVAELFREDAVFRSPIVFKPYEGRDRVLKVLRAAKQVLGVGDAFRYVHQLEDPDDRVAILEFATEVDGRQVEGIDELTFDEDGLIDELKVMIRPASALQVVGARMAKEFARVGLSVPT
jgi:heme-degrading monooxygenase HmoA/ketosteroid isomerase-like protein